ncbi:MAG: phytanoyl-CoA dioxygenase family protein [Flavobacteriales bacterium]|jgi:hypothetical protein
MGIQHILETGRRLYRNRLAGQKKDTFPPLDAQQTQWLSELKENGVIKIPGFLSSEECASIRQTLNTVMDSSGIPALLSTGEAPKLGWDTGKGYAVWSDREMSDTRIIHAEVIHDKIRAFNEDIRLCDVGKHYLQADVQVIYTMANRVVYKEHNKGSGGGWHRDIPYRRGFKAMLYLCDVDTHGGPFQYIPHSDSALYHLFKTNHPDQYQFTHQEVMNLIHGDESRLVEATATEGTLMLFETNLIHRGKPISEGRIRYAMTNYHNF